MKNGGAEDMGKNFKKYQAIFDQNYSLEELKVFGISAVSVKKIGSITYIVTTGINDEEIIKEKLHPTLLESVPIDNEELIMLEMLSAKNGGNNNA